LWEWDVSLERKDREREEEGGKRERAESRRERTEKRRDERGSVRRRDKVTGTGMEMAISEEWNDANMWQRVYKGGGERAASEKKKKERGAERLMSSWRSRVSGHSHSLDGRDMGSPRLSQHAVRAPSAVSFRPQLSI
jgi:hypothetical protein